MNQETGATSSTSTTVQIDSAGQISSSETSQQRTTVDYALISSLKERIEKSTIIVLGKVTELGEVVNASRDVEDNTKPSSTSFGVGQVYRVQVMRYLKGAGPDTINIIQVEGFIDQIDPRSITRQDIDQAKSSYEYVPLRADVTYAFFLDPFMGQDIGDNYFVGGAGGTHPWRFELSPDGKGIADAPHGIGAGPGFLPDSNAPLLPQVEQIVQAERGAPSSP